jgi:hypothetical protein
MTETQIASTDAAAVRLLDLIARDIRDGRDPAEAFSAYCTKFANEYPTVAAAILTRIA